MATPQENTVTFESLPTPVAATVSVFDRKIGEIGYYVTGAGETKAMFENLIATSQPLPQEASGFFLQDELKKAGVPDGQAQEIKNALLVIQASTRTFAQMQGLRELLVHGEADAIESKKIDPKYGAPGPDDIRFKFVGDARDPEVLQIAQAGYAAAATYNNTEYRRVMYKANDFDVRRFALGASDYPRDYIVGFEQSALQSLVVGRAALGDVAEQLNQTGNPKLQDLAVRLGETTEQLGAIPAYYAELHKGVSPSAAATPSAFMKQFISNYNIESQQEETALNRESPPINPKFEAWAAILGKNANTAPAQKAVSNNKPQPI